MFAVEFKEEGLGEGFEEVAVAGEENVVEGVEGGGEAAVV